jgi:hypothetical protein
MQQHMRAGAVEEVEISALAGLTAPYRAKVAIVRTGRRGFANCLSMPFLSWTTERRITAYEVLLLRCEC